jgi:hypothetical protein
MVRPAELTTILNIIMVGPLKEDVGYEDPCAREAGD